MLILTRKPGESIIVGDNVTITLLGVRGNQCRIGIDAPVEITIHRQEIYNRIKSQQQKQVKNSSVDEQDRIEEF